jgi:hypothetical protein
MQQRPTYSCLWLATGIHYEIIKKCNEAFESVEKLKQLVMEMPITVASQSKDWSFFARPNTGIVGSNPPQNMDVSLHLFCVCVVLL